MSGGGAAAPAPVVAPVDTVGAFVGEPAVLATGAPGGPLAGVRLAVKDLFDVAGTVTGAGNPTFAAGRAPATAHAPAVARLLAAGATVVGKTITDEMAYSLSGTNVHFGTPTNVAAPGRVPGGSSAGSAAAVAAGLVELALGTDTGGSIRVPASYCGILGWRPTHGAVPIDGVVPLSPSFDTAGLFAADPHVLLAGARALLAPGDPPPAGDGVAPLVLLAEAQAEVPPEVAAEVVRVATALAERTGAPVAPPPVRLGIDLDAATTAFRAAQAREAWAQNGAWIERVRPAMGPGITARFAAASRITDDEVAAALALQRRVVDAVDRLTAGGTVLVVPTAPGPAPAPATDRARHEAQRTSTIRLTSVPGLAGVPVVVVPLARAEGLPLGVALVGARGTDLDLLALAATAMATAGPAGRGGDATV